VQAQLKQLGPLPTQWVSAPPTAQEIIRRSGSNTQMCMLIFLVVVLVVLVVVAFD